jgi:hypothetical protein
VCKTHGIYCRAWRGKGHLQRSCPQSPELVSELGAGSQRPWHHHVCLIHITDLGMTHQLSGPLSTLASGSQSHSQASPVCWQSMTSEERMGSAQPPGGRTPARRQLCFSGSLPLATVMLQNPFPSAGGSRDPPKAPLA